VRISPVWPVIALLAGCSDGSGPDSGGCPQTYEFGNFGCARVEGVVRDTAGTPIANASVVLLPADGVPNTFNSPARDTDAHGNYSLEIKDYGGEGVHPLPEPVPMNLRAYLLDPAVENAVVIASELVPVTLRFAPVGETPEVARVDITIPVP
jgi:hypothetical protein